MTSFRALQEENTSDTTGSAADPSADFSGLFLGLDATTLAIVCSILFVAILLTVLYCVVMCRSSTPKHGTLKVVTSKITSDNIAISENESEDKSDTMDDEKDDDEKDDDDDDRYFLELDDGSPKSERPLTPIKDIMEDPPNRKRDKRRNRRAEPNSPGLLDASPLDNNASRNHGRKEKKKKKKKKSEDMLALDTDLRLSWSDMEDDESPKRSKKKKGSRKNGSRRKKY